MLIGTMSYAQSIAPQSVNSSGTKLTQANGSLSFTVGELVVLTQIDNDGNTLGGGFTTSSTLTTAILEEPDLTILDVNVFPNPTTELVNIQINYSKINQIVATITDIQGKEIYCGKYVSFSNIIGINTSTFSKGIYILTLKNTNSQLLGTYKIIKNF